jgi:iron complex outermembrane receptor protein
VRHTRLKIDVADRFLANGNDSGSVAYSRATPLLGVLYKLAPAMNVYASAARGFETPTLNELFYSGAGAGFNFGLQPATSLHLEAGVKALVAANARVDVALFQVRTHDELVVDSSTGGRTSYRNAGKTLRQGAEVSASMGQDQGWNGRLALTVLRAVYDEGFGKVVAGSRLPGVANASLYGELGWKDEDGRIGAALESFVSANAYPDDANQAQPAPGYAVFNARVQTSQELEGWRLKQFIRLNNLFGRKYVGSLIVGDSNQRYYEAAPGRNWIAGVSAQYLFR